MCYERSKSECIITNYMRNLVNGHRETVVIAAAVNVVALMEALLHQKEYCTAGRLLLKNKPRE